MAFETRVAAASINAMPCHQKWLGSRLTLTFSPVTSASRANEAAL